MTRINPDDPKWTAYILDELSETDRAAVELELQSSEEAQMLVEELRFAADLTKTELRVAFSISTRVSSGMKVSLVRVITILNCDSSSFCDSRFATSSVATFSGGPNRR